MPTSVLKSKKTSGSLSNHYIDNRQENRLYLVFYDFQKIDKGPTRLKKQNYCNKLSFCSSIRL